MLNEHDQDVLLRCCRLGQEVTFGYCRQENRGKPCRLILDCWWESFDVRAFLRAHLSEAQMSEVEQASASPPPAKVPSLVDLVRQTQTRLESEDDKTRDSSRRNS